MLSRNRKTFAVSSLVLNLFASQIGEFFLPHPVFIAHCEGEEAQSRNIISKNDVRHAASCEFN